jgi:CTP:phosphocholine cytidylyltransferase-like protein
MDRIKATSVILAAGVSNRMKSYEPRSLLKVGGYTLSEIQVSNFKQRYDGDIVLVSGFKANKVNKKLSKIGVKVVENKNYQDTSAFESLRLALQDNKTDSACIIHGDILFNLDSLDVDHSESFILADNNNQIHEREVGVISIDGEVTTLYYGLPLKWAQITYVTGKEYNLLKQMCELESAKFSRRLWFEAINHIIDLGGKFKCYTPPNMQILEIDAIGDLRK